MNLLPAWDHGELIVRSALIAAAALGTVSVVVCGAVFALTGGLGRAPKTVAAPAPAKPAQAQPVRGQGALAAAM
jgi:hypothetical protein